jgi:hypothetical protein
MAAWVGPEVGGWTVFSVPWIDPFAALARQISGSEEAYAAQIMANVANTPLRLAVFGHVYDDDVLTMIAMRDGKTLFHYISRPAAMLTGGLHILPPRVEGDEAFAAAIGTDVDATALHRLLWRPGDFAIAIELHADVLRLTGMPAYAAGFGYDYASRGEFGYTGSSAPLGADQVVEVKAPS